MGLGDETGLYAGTQILNQAQLDRWTLICRLDFMDEAAEVRLLTEKAPHLSPDVAEKMVRFAAMTRLSFQAGDLSVLMSPRGLLHWAAAIPIFNTVTEQQICFPQSP